MGNVLKNILIECFKIMLLLHLNLMYTNVIEFDENYRVA